MPVYRFSHLASAPQYGTITMTGAVTSNTATINSVITANSVVEYLGNDYDSGSGGDQFLVQLTLTNATTVTATRTSAGGSVVVVSFVVWEFIPNVLKSNQDFTIVLTGVTSNTGAVGSAVVVAKSVPISRGAKASSTQTGATNTCLYRYTLTDTTTLTGTIGTTNNSVTIYGTLLEFQ